MQERCRVAARRRRDTEALSSEGAQKRDAEMMILAADA